MESLSEAQLDQLKCGLYQITFTQACGPTSAFAAVGKDSYGRTWMAATNWSSDPIHKLGRQYAMVAPISSGGFMDGMIARATPLILNGDAFPHAYRDRADQWETWPAAS